MAQPNETQRKRWGAAVAARRTALGDGHSQVWLAAEVGLHPQTVSEIERGILAGSPETRARIAAALDLDLADYFPPDEEGAA